MRSPDTQSDAVTIESSELAAIVKTKGAELCSLRPHGGEERLWQADPAVWPWHAPNLFPIVGALADDTLVHRGERYPMPSHGFLRHSMTTVVDQSFSSVRLQLVDSPETRVRYPFPFGLTIEFRVDADRLRQSFEVANPGDEPLLVSLGAHPAFAWPLLAKGITRTAHIVQFAGNELQPIRRATAGGLSSASYPTPLQDGRVLPLDDSLFEPGAIIWDRVERRAVTFGVPDGPAIEMEFADFPHFALWTKPGAGFLCLEPWQGHVSPLGFRGELALKPGIVEIAPGGSRSWSLTIRPISLWAL